MNCQKKKFEYHKPFGTSKNRLNYLLTNPPVSIKQFILEEEEDEKRRRKTKFPFGFTSLTCLHKIRIYFLILAVGVFCTQPKMAENDDDELVLVVA